MPDTEEHLSVTGTCMNSINDMGNMLMPDSSFTLHCSSATHCTTSLSLAALCARTWSSTSLSSIRCSWCSHCSDSCESGRVTELLDEERKQ